MYSGWLEDAAGSMQDGWLTSAAAYNLGRMKMMFDTGNTPRTIVSFELNAYLKAASDSNTQFLSAFGPGKTGADKIGTLPMSILGLKPHEETALDLEVTTIESVNTSLMSYYQMFQAGFDLHITAGTADDSCGDDELPDLVSDDPFINSKGYSALDIRN
eukprot:COSAG01_NODE_6355_length_3715_cov_17.318584_4_plen_159_part_00